MLLCKLFEQGSYILAMESCYGVSAPQQAMISHKSDVYVNGLVLSRDQVYYEALITNIDNDVLRTEARTPLAFNLEILKELKLMEEVA